MNIESNIDKIFISKIALSNYRNFERFEYDFDQRPVLIIGENGAGKTNILESISLLSPGRGLRYSKFDDVCRNTLNKMPVNAISDIDISNNIGKISFRSVFDCNSHKRLIEFNGSKIPTKDLSQFMNIIWITPDMHHIFTGSRSDRLKFVDRIVYSFVPLHATLINKYDHYIQERRSLLKIPHYDEEWISVVEKKLSEIAVQITSNRKRIISKINNISQNSKFDFPKIYLELNSEIDNLQCNDEDILNILIKKYKDYRKLDLDSGKSNFGPQKTELIAIHLDKNINASSSSMGQQKAILVSIILSQILGLIEETQRLPIILLDEVFAHLDQKRSMYLSEFLLDLGIQIWITDTGVEHIDFFYKNTNLLRL